IRHRCHLRGSRRCESARAGRARRGEAVLRGARVSIPPDQIAFGASACSLTMARWVLQGRPPRGDRSIHERIEDPDRVRQHLEDAARFRGGNAPALYTPVSEAEIATILRTNRAILPIGAQSSLTGGATPMGEAVLSTRRLDRIRRVGRERVSLGAGVTLVQLDEVLAESGAYYPPRPTFIGAFVGGTGATHAPRA